MMAARLSPGAISESSSSHLPPIEGSKPAKPVMFPLGRSSRGTMPVATGSLAVAKTIDHHSGHRQSARVAGGGRRCVRTVVDRQMPAGGSRQRALRVFGDGKLHGVGIGCQRLDGLHARAAMRKRDNAISQFASADNLTDSPPNESGGVSSW